MQKNILILSAGRRVELVNCFHLAAKKMKKRFQNFESRVIAADLSNMAPAGFFADSYETLPRIGSPDYIESIIELANRYKVSLIVPTIDTELLILAKERERIERETEAKLLVSDLSVVEICRDKIRTCSYLKKHGFMVPERITEESIERNEVRFPVFIKPLNGSSSIQTFKINDMRELLFFKDYVKNPIIQEYIEGEEYSVDVFLDFESNIITTVPRQRLAVRGGEISKGIIVRDKEIISSVCSLMNVLKPVGQITVQCMKTEKGIKYIEINPRFGGGAPMSIMSGADSCENLYRLLSGEKLSYQDDYREGDIYLRFDESICINKSGERIVQ